MRAIYLAHSIYIYILTESKTEDRDDEKEKVMRSNLYTSTQHRELAFY